MKKIETHNGNMPTTPKVDENEIRSRIYNSAAHVAAADLMAKTLSFSLERKYLDVNDCVKSYNYCEEKPNPIQWIKIQQIGKPIKDDESCYLAMQKIIRSCHLPNKTRLLMLIVCENGICSMYIGVSKNNEVVSEDFINEFESYIRGIWPGVQTEIVETINWEKHFCSQEEKESNKDIVKYKSVFSLTGIPSVEYQNEVFYPSTIDKLVSGSIYKNFSYLVIAEPIERKDIDEMLDLCRETIGQAESLKSFSISDNSGIAKTNMKSRFESVSKKDLSSTGAKILAGLGGVGMVLSAIGTIKSYNAVNPLEASAGSALSSFGAQIANTANSLIPQKTEGSTEGSTVTANYAKTICQNVVNRQIEAVSKNMSFYEKRFEDGKATGMWNVGAYLLGENDKDLQTIALQLSATLSGNESIFEPIRHHDVSDLKCDVKKFNDEKVSYVVANSLKNAVMPNIEIYDNDKLIEHIFGKHYSTLTTILTTKELSCHINFPQHSIPGISVVESSPEFSLDKQIDNSENTFRLGNLLYGGAKTNLEFCIPMKLLSKHTLLTGINGSGKTNTVKSILNNLSGKLPFMIIEPAKTEYVDWAIEYNGKQTDEKKKIDIYIPGCKQYKIGNIVPKNLKINPFEVVWLDPDQEPHVLTHIDRLKSTFASAFPMYDILPVLLEDLIYAVYQVQSNNWLSKEPCFGRTQPPTLNSMGHYVDLVINKRKYEERVERNMKACLNTRIDSLKRGWKGEMLNCIHSTPWEELFDKPCIINLSYVGDEIDKAFFMSLILQFLYEYRNAQSEIGKFNLNDNECRHLTVIEEAHRVMTRCDNMELPQYKSAMMFSDMLSEIRAYGEGLLLVDQVPTRLIPDAIKNTNLKLTHRIVAEDDCKAIAESMGLNENQRKIMAKLKVGQCIVSSPNTTEPYWVCIDEI